MLTPELREVVFGGERLWLDPAAAVYFPDHGVLVVSDLHLEKGSALGWRGAPLPLYDSADTLTALQALLTKYQPRQVVLLGDTFHDAKALTRLPDIERQRLVDMVRQVANWCWIAGNHDAKLAPVLPGQHALTLQVGAVQLAHQPMPGMAPLMIGHYHPKLTTFRQGARISGKVFLHDTALMILPAFGRYTGGLATSDKVFRTLLHDPQTHLIYRGRVWRMDYPEPDSLHGSVGT